MKNLIKPLLILTVLFFSFDSMAQDKVKPEASLSSKTNTTKKVKPEKPVDALSSKSSSTKIVKKSVPSQKLSAPKAKAVLTEKKEIK